jgi:hypothetical protein
MVVRVVAVVLSLALIAPGPAVAAPTAVADPDLDSPSPPPEPAANPGYSAPGYSAPGYSAPGYSAPGHGPPPPAGYDPYLEDHLAREWQFAAGIQKALGENHMDVWHAYVKEERKRARKRAKGDEDELPESFDKALFGKVKKRRTIGVVVFAVGFVPTIFSGVLAYDFADPSFMIGALFGVPFWTAGGIVWGLGQARVNRYNQAKASLGKLGLRPPRLQFRGAAPLVNPYTGTGGLTLAFAF